MRFNQVNQNGGDVNNVFSEGGPVVQTVGNAGTANTAASSQGPAVQPVGQTGNTTVEQPKDSFWAQAWSKLKGVWKLLVG